VKASFLGVVVLLIFSFWYVQADFSKLWAPRSAQLLAGVIQDVFPPDGSQLVELFTLSLETLAMSILAMAGAGIGGILLSFPAAHNFLLPGGIFDTGRFNFRLPILDFGLGFTDQETEPTQSPEQPNNPKSKIVRLNFDRLSYRADSELVELHAEVQNPKSFGWGTAVLVFTRFVLLFARAVPEPIWALIFLFVLFPGILPGAIALGLHNLGILGRLMAEVTENLDERPLRSLKALGATGPQVFLYGVLPRTLPRFVAYILYRWEVCIRATVIVGLVGAGGLGRLLTEQLSSFDYKGVLTTLIVFLALTFLVDLISASVRRTLR
jgi:phosphonate transport system permease protein